MATPFSTQRDYQVAHGLVIGEAFSANDTAACEEWLKTEVAKRVYDQPMVDELKEEMLALKSEDFDIENLVQFIELPTPDAQYWDIGESIADLFLIDRVGAHLPSNRRRDLRTPKGSLPGADIVGLHPDGNGGTMFVFGEIKASADSARPPSVMTNPDSGMVAQMRRLFTRIDIQRQLMYYLRDRCREGELPALFQAALRSLAEKRFALVGVLVRDTVPDKKDVEGPAMSINKSLNGAHACRLYVLHTGVSAADWASHCKAC